MLLQLRISSSSKSSREKIILTKASQDLRFQNLLYLLKYENTRSIDECCQDDHVKQCEDALAEVFRCVVFPKQHIQQAPQMHAAIQLIHRMQVCYQNKINQYCARKNEEEKSEDSYMAILKILFHLQRQRIYQVLKFAAQNCNCIVECLPYLKSIDIAPKDFLREVMVNSGILKGYF